MKKKKQTYPEKLIAENKIEILGVFTRAKDHHDLRCLICGHKWNATPKSKVQTLRINGVSGCPGCHQIRLDEEQKISRELVIEMLNERGIEVLDGWDGRRHIKNANTYSTVHVRNNNCGHDFHSSPTNLISNGVVCGVCGPTKRGKAVAEYQKQNHKK